MKYLNYIKIVLVFILVVPFLSFAENGAKDNVKGTYTLQYTQDCVQGPADSVNSSTVQVTAVGEFTLDGEGGYVYRGDEVYIVNGGYGFMGQNDDYCVGAYFLEGEKNSLVVNIPQQTCTGKLTQGSFGSPQENPVVFSNYSVNVLDVSLIFQRGNKAGIYSDIPPPETPVDVETLVVTDYDSNFLYSSDRRCLRAGTFFHKGRFSVLTQPDPAPPPPL